MYMELLVGIEWDGKYQFVFGCSDHEIESQHLLYMLIFLLFFSIFFQPNWSDDYAHDLLVSFSRSVLPHQRHQWRGGRRVSRWGHHVAQAGLQAASRCSTPPRTTSSTHTRWQTNGRTPVELGPTGKIKILQNSTNKSSTAAAESNDNATNQESH